MGAGKTSFAELICKTVFAADDYFIDKDGNYNWVGEKINDAHVNCQGRTRDAMEHGLTKICVANTSITEKELKPYYDLAKQYNYKVFSIIVENRANTTNIHNVPEDTIQKMRERFNIKL